LKECETSVGQVWPLWCILRSKLYRDASVVAAVRRACLRLHG